MSLFDKLASGLSGQNQRKGTTSNTSTSSRNSVNMPKQVWWQCRYCGRRCATYGDQIPKAGICVARGKTNTGFPKPHEWRKIK